MQNKTLSGILVTATLAVLTVPASAGIVLYTNQALWQAAVTGASTSAVDLSGAVGFFGPSYASGGLTFTGNPTPPQYNGIPYVFGSGTPSAFFGNQYYVFGNGLLTISMPGAANIFSIAFNEGCSSGCNPSLQNLVTATSTTDSSTTLFNQSPYANWPNLNVSGIGTAPLFFGIVSTSPLTQIVLTSHDTVPNIAVGDITTAGQSTPEAATLILIGTGLGVIARYRRYSTSVSAA